ncbi:MAG: hypothetical protein M3O67_06985 [Bacteroidota bacterium]|nr:hypothetical protein [Bacteroidota bacterium]
MKLQKYFLTLLLIPFFGFVKDNDEFIDWSESRRLGWDDFVAPVNNKSDAAASTSTYLGLEYNIRDNSFNYRIACRFYKTKSWGLVKNNWILNHEQGHFDITEIFARLLNKAMSEYVFNYKTYRKDVNTIYQNYMKQKELFQELYDTETDYSRNKKVQEEWLKKIEVLLKETEEYANYN